MRRKKQKSSEREVLNFIAEAGMLKQVKRSGWQVLGIKNAESVAEHSFRCTVIGYILAEMEGVKPYKALLMTLFGDLPEARITDLHKMAQKYINYETAENTSFYGQINSLPKNMKKELMQMHREYRAQNTTESIIARDADILECLIQAKEYYEQGHLQAAKFMKKAPRFLKTKSARCLWQLAKKTNLNDWWFKLCEFKR